MGVRVSEHASFLVCLPWAWASMFAAPAPALSRATRRVRLTRCVRVFLGKVENLLLCLVPGQVDNQSHDVWLEWWFRCVSGEGDGGGLCRGGLQMQDGSCGCMTVLRRYSKIVGSTSGLSAIRPRSYLHLSTALFVGARGGAANVRTKVVDRCKQDLGNK